MRRLRKREGFRQPTLVPLADMLCNTLGIVIFILVFTVLTTGDAVTHTAFPMEQTDSHYESLMVICSGNRICPILESVFDDLRRAAKPGNLDDLEKWKYEDSYCRASFDRFTVIVDAKIDNGDSPSDVGSGGSAMNALLSKQSPSAKFVYFLVCPDLLGAFAAARDAARKAGFKTGWTPHDTGEPVRIGVGGGGGITPGFQ